MLNARATRTARFEEKNMTKGRVLKNEKPRGPMQHKPRAVVSFCTMSGRAYYHAPKSDMGRLNKDCTSAVSLVFKPARLR